MFGFEPDAFIPYMIFAIPIIAIIGGITLAIVRSLGRQRLIELAQQERIAAIQRGIEPSKLPPLPVVADDDDLTSGISASERDRRRSQGLLIGGVVTLGAGAGLTAFLAVIRTDEPAWAVGLIPNLVGVALLISAWIVAPKGGTRS